MKNLALLVDKPLLSYSIEAAIESAVCDLIIVSTDSADIGEHAARYGVRVLERPAELAQDTASTESVLLHVLNECGRAGEIWEYVLTLPPTSPLRSAATIREFVEYWWTVFDRFDAMISVTEDRGDHWQRAADGSLVRLFPDAPRRQQDRQPLYEENSAIYITKAAALRATGSILGGAVTGWVMDRSEAVDVNDSVDLAIADCFLRLRDLGARGAAAQGMDS